MGGLAIRKRAARPAQRPPLTAPVRGASARAGRDEGTAAVGIIRSPVRASILPDYIRVKRGKSQVEQIFSALPQRAVIYACTTASAAALANCRFGV